MPLNYISKYQAGTVNLKGIIKIVLLISVLLAVSYPGDLFAQGRNTTDQRLRLAQNLERQGELESALMILKELYTIQPENVLYANNYTRILERLEKFDEWILILNDRIERQPKNTGLTGELGRAYYLSGELAGWVRMPKM